MAGILVGIYFSSILLHVLNFFVIVFALVYSFYAFREDKIKKRLFLFKYLSAILLFGIFSVAYFLSTFYNQKAYKTHYSKFIKQNNYNLFQIKILETPILKRNSFKIIAEIIKTYDNKTIHKTKGKILIYISNKDSLQIKSGDILNVKSKISTIEGAKNPNEFNYKDYLKYQNIYYQSYIKKQDWHKNGSVFILNSKILFIRNHLQKLINKYIFNEEERAIASALLIGNRTLLNDDTLRAFSSSGATHILAVSGLHVGIFYGLLSFSLSWLQKFQKLKILQPILIIIAIWFYVLLTGASPSVMRAATMFSLFALGKTMNRYFSVFNLIAFSAIILIVINPYIVTEVGFQLSYFAVIGIIYLQPRLYSLFISNNYVIDKVWTITTVSLAAQISTFPLILLYFHQFPNLFWISNLFVIPAAALILYGGIFLFLVSWNYNLAWFVGFLLSWSIKFLNYCLSLIENIPFALSTGLHISRIQSVFIYILFIWVSVTFVKRSKLLLKYSLLLSLGIIVSLTNKYIDTKTQEIFTVYFTPKFSAIEIISGNTSYAKIDSELIKNDKQMLFRIKHNWWEKGVVNFDKLKLYKLKNNKIVNYKNNKILLIDSFYSIPKSIIEIDYLVVSHNPKLYLEKFSKKVKTKMYIFDTSNDSKHKYFWKKDCKNLKLNCYFVSDTVAFEVKL